MGKAIHPAGKHFMDIALMSHVKHNAVHIGVKDLMEGYGQLNSAQIGGQVASCFRDAVDEKAPYFTAQGLILFRSKGQELVPILCSFQKIQNYTTCLFCSSSVST